MEWRMEETQVMVGRRVHHKEHRGIHYGSSITILKNQAVHIASSKGKFNPKV